MAVVLITDIPGATREMYRQAIDLDLKPKVPRPVDWQRCLPLVRTNLVEEHLSLGARRRGCATGAWRRRDAARMPRRCRPSPGWFLGVGAV